MESRARRDTSTMLQYYDARGRLVAGTAEPTSDRSVREHFEYDAQGRLVAILSQDAREGNDGNCDVEGGCPEPARSTTQRIDLVWDGSGRLRQRIRRRDEYVETRRKHVWEQTTADAIMSELELGYDGAGRLVTVTAGRHRRTFEYDIAGLPVREIVEQPGAPPRRYEITHDARGRIVGREAPEHTYWFRYDDHGRVVRRDLLGAPGDEQYETWEYDARGAVIWHRDVRGSVRSGSPWEHTLELRYDELGRLQETRAGGKLQKIFTYAGACDAVKNAPPPPDPLGMGPERCLTSPGGVLPTCWW